MVDIVTCPECGRPRALGHRCPSCGDAAAPADPAAQSVSASDAAQSWQQPTSFSGAASTSPSTFGSTYASATPAQPAVGQKKGGGRLATFILVAALIVGAIVVAVVLTTGGAAVVEEQAAVAGTPDKASDLAAESLIRNAMTAFDAVAVESGGYEGISQTTLQTMEPAITWMQGRGGVCMSPPTGANAKQSVVAWVSTGPMSYELGTRSSSGTAVGVRVDRMGGGTTYYKDGQAGAW